MSKVTKTEVVFGVRMMVPEGANVPELQDFVRSAIASYGGGLDPESPFFDIKGEHFTVSLQHKKVTTTYVKTVRPK